MNKAEECKKKSIIVTNHPPILIDPQPRMVGYLVYCGNDSVKEYHRKQQEERRKKHGKDS